MRMIIIYIEVRVPIIAIQPFLAFISFTVITLTDISWLSSKWIRCIRVVSIKRIISLIVHSIRTSLNSTLQSIPTTWIQDTSDAHPNCRTSNWIGKTESYSRSIIRTRK
jgi:hypothetical protein